MPIFVRRDQAIERIRQLLEPHMHPGERLEAQIMAQTSASIGQMAALGALSVTKRRIIYLGVTDTGNLIVLEHEFMDRPRSARRVLVSDIEKASYRKGLLANTLRITVPGYGPMKLQVAKWLQEQARALMDRISGGA